MIIDLLIQAGTFFLDNREDAEPSEISTDVEPGVTFEPETGLLVDHLTGNYLTEGQERIVSQIVKEESRKGNVGVQRFAQKVFLKKSPEEPPEFKSSEEVGEEISKFTRLYQEIDDPALRYEFAGHISLLAEANGDDQTSFAYLSMAQQNAMALPGGDIVEAPLVEADTLANAGKFSEANDAYKGIEKGIEKNARSMPRLKDKEAQVKGHHQAVLAAGIPYLTLKYQTEKSSAAKIQTGSEVMTLAEDLYRLVPIENHLKVVFQASEMAGFGIYTLQSNYNGMSIADLKHRIEENRRLIDDHGTSPLLVEGPVKNTEPLSENWLSDSLDKDQINKALAENAALAPQIAQAEKRLLGLVGEVHRNDPITHHEQTSLTHLLMGDRSNAGLHLNLALSAFYEKRNSSPMTREEALREITLLHRLASIPNTQSAKLSGYLDRAANSIWENDLTHDQPDTAILRVENAELKSRVNIDLLQKRLAKNEINEEEYGNTVRQGYQTVIDTVDEALLAVRDPETREQLRGTALQAKAAIIEHDLDTAFVRHLEGQTENKDGKKSPGELIVQATLGLGDLEKSRGRASDINYSEAAARANLALAYYNFRTGSVETALTSLKEIVASYPQSSAAGVIRSGWPREYGITDENGNFTAKLNEPSVLAGIKTAAAELTENMGRNLGACGVGAVAGGLADAYILKGKANLAKSAIVGCTIAVLGERTVHLVENSSRISEAYRTGVSHVSGEEALKSAGLFTLNLLSMYVGGAAGALAEKAALAAGSYAGKRLTASLIGRFGVTPGPWMRAAGAFALHEGATVANAVAFHKATGAINGVMFGASPEENEALGLLDSWFFVRMFKFMHVANPGGAIARGQALADRVVREGINTITAAGGLVIGHALAQGRGPSLDNVANESLNYAAMHFGNKAIAAGMPLRTLAKIGNALERKAIQNLLQTRRLIENALKRPGPGGPSGLQPAFAVAGFAGLRQKPGSEPSKPSTMSNNKMMSKMVMVEEEAPIGDFALTGESPPPPMTGDKLRTGDTQEDPSSTINVVKFINEFIQYYRQASVRSRIEALHRPEVKSRLRDDLPPRVADVFLERARTFEGNLRQIEGWIERFRDVQLGSTPERRTDVARSLIEEIASADLSSDIAHLKNREDKAGSNEAIALDYRTLREALENIGAGKDEHDFHLALKALIITRLINSDYRYVENAYFKAQWNALSIRNPLDGSVAKERLDALTTALTTLSVRSRADLRDRHDLQDREGIDYRLVYTSPWDLAPALDTSNLGRSFRETAMKDLVRVEISVPAGQRRTFLRDLHSALVWDGILLRDANRQNPSVKLRTGDIVDLTIVERPARMDRKTDSGDSPPPAATGTDGISSRPAALDGATNYFASRITRGLDWLTGALGIDAIVDSLQPALAVAGGGAMKMTPKQDGQKIPNAMMMTKGTVEKLIAPFATSKQIALIRSLILGGDPASIQKIRENLATRIREDGGCKNMDQISQMIRSEVERLIGLDELYLKALKQNQGLPDQETGLKLLSEMQKLSQLSHIQFLPDTLPVYRMVSREAIRKGPNGEFVMAPNRDQGKSYWSIGKEGIEVARGYGDKTDVLVKATIGELRKSGSLETDNVAVSGNALKLRHAQNESGARLPVRVELFSSKQADINNAQYRKPKDTLDEEAVDLLMGHQKPFRKLTKLFDLQLLTYPGENGGEALYRNTPQFEKRLQNLVRQVREQHPSEIGPMVALLMENGFDADGIRIETRPARSDPNPVSPPPRSEPVTPNRTSSPKSEVIPQQQAYVSIKDLTSRAAAHVEAGQFKEARVLLDKILGRLNDMPVSIERTPEGQYVVTRSPHHERELAAYQRVDDRLKSRLQLPK